MPKKDFIRKLITFAPTQQADEVRESLFAAGAGKIGNYSECSFTSAGTGSYKGNDDSNPVIGQKGSRTELTETKIEVTFEKHLEHKIMKALFTSHPYEEVAYEVYNLQNSHQNIGLGMIGELENPMDEENFLHLVREKMQSEGIRHTAYLGKPVHQAAVLGGSGSFAISSAIAAGADVFLTSDLKYHQYYEAENRILLADIGHFESERYTKNYIVDFLTEKLPNFAIILSEVNTNPVKYL